MLRVSLGLLCVVLAAAPISAADGFPFKEGDRVAWIGSSSTNIGVWPKTMEFLLRTRYPELKLTFKRFTTGGGTFATGAEKLDGWLAEFKPTVVLFNYGGNDAGGGEKGLPKFKDNIEKCVAKVQAAGARVLFTTPQAADVRKSKEGPAANRKLYAEALLAYAKEKGWPAYDVHHPLDELQKAGQKDDDAFTINKDTIHLTDPAYIAWGYYLYERMLPPTEESSATLTAAGEVKATKGCKISDVQNADGKLTFVRADEVLPILPPVALPPRKYVPLEKLSAYRLGVTGLPKGEYEISCEGKPLGVADAAALASGVNLNTLLLDAKNPAPWETLAKSFWAGKELDQIGKTRLRFEVRKKPS
jgi:lysophospholipase L1-like esterase